MIEFVVEHCMNCSNHGFSTYHDEEKYNFFAQQLQAELGGPSRCRTNEIPGSWLKSPLFKGVQFTDFVDRKAKLISF